MADSMESRSQLKQELSVRLRQVRIARYGEFGESALAEALGVPARTWHNYEAGIGVPGEIVLAFLVLTDVEPRWLLGGEGETFRQMRS